jgi:fructose/tagatose bisphosphate aldolase
MALNFGPIHGLFSKNEGRKLLSMALNFGQVHGLFSKNEGRKLLLTTSCRLGMKRFKK